MRRKDREVTDFEEMINIVEECDCCRIGITDDSCPYIVPMNFGYECTDNDFILYFHSSKKGKKLDLIKKQNIASFEMDSKHELIPSENPCGYSFSYQSIIGMGEIEIIEDENGKIHGLERIMEHYTGKKDWDYEKKILELTALIRLTVKEWSCKKH